MSGIMDNQLRGKILQAMQSRKTYGNYTYKEIAKELGVKFETVRFYAKTLINDRKIDLNSYIHDSNVPLIKRETSNYWQKVREQASEDVSSTNIRQDIKNMLDGKIPKDRLMIKKYIKYCRENLNTKNITSEDVCLLAQIVTSNKSSLTSQNIKLVILGFVKSNKIGMASKFYKQCSKLLEATDYTACTQDELAEIKKSLDDYQNRLEVYAKLKAGYPLEVIIADAKLSEAEIRKMYSVISATKSSKANQTYNAHQER